MWGQSNREDQLGKYFLPRFVRAGEENGFFEAIYEEMVELGWLGLICSEVFVALLINEAGDEPIKKEYPPPIILGK